jgi:glycosyltransferase involved in cell wall biosynthesis
VPCYNGSEHLRETLASLLAQTLPPFEIIVVDDGSTDDSLAIAQSYGPPVMAVSQVNSGAAKARATGAERARGDVVVYADAGDLSTPDRLARFQAAFEQQPQAVAAYALTLLKERGRSSRSNLAEPVAEGAVVAVPDPLAIMIGQSHPIAVAMNIAVRRDVAVQAARGLDEYRAANDYALQLGVAARGAFAFVNCTTLEYITSPNGITRTQGTARQAAYALVAACMAMRDPQLRTADRLRALRRRIEAEWVEVMGDALAGGHRALARRVLRLGWPYVRWASVPRKLWWYLARRRAS